MSNVLLLSGAPEPAAEILPSLSLLPHSVRLAPAVAASADGTPPSDLVLVDARRDLVQVRQLLRQLRAAGLDVPMLVIVAEGGWAAVSAEWGADDVILHTAGPGEVDARLRIAIGRTAPAVSGEIRAGDLAIDEITYSARLHGRALDLTFKEFELLKFLAQSPGRVFSRSQLLQEVWGYDYFGGTRTVDVHVRRLRAKLGAEHEALIGTVRNVGYRFVPVKGDTDRPTRDAEPGRRGHRATRGRTPESSRDRMTRTAAAAKPSGTATRIRILSPVAPRPTGGRRILRTPNGDRAGPAISVPGRLSESEVAAVLALVRAAAEEDGVGPLSEHVMLHLRYGGDPSARNLLLVSGGELVGYAHLDPTDPVAGPSGELVIHPGRRGQGLGLELLNALVAEANGRQLRLWAHGDLPAAARLAPAAGFKRVRALWQMRRSLQARLELPQLGTGVTVRTFEVGRDEDEWIDLNARAFATHPEQGGWTRADLDLREREPWFDPAGFFLAERGGKLVGFHWTKIHGQAAAGPRMAMSPSARSTWWASILRTAAAAWVAR